VARLSGTGAGARTARALLAGGVARHAPRNGGAPGAAGTDSARVAEVSGLRGKGALIWLSAPLKLMRALAQALAVIRRRRPALVVGLGGFVAGPGGLAAWLLRKPLLIHEQNAIAGFTNRCLSHLARRVLEAFPGSFANGVKAEAVGNPVRREITQLPPPAERFTCTPGSDSRTGRGWQPGSARLNSTVPFALARTMRTLPLEVLHQSGERWIEAARAAIPRPA
jgi:UDP-N-acetylglucosamine--N-acetylmuramyl-(pentapeptide) pyrophosphoryl-undecaprenol N-acetylglucosamine transferase